MLIIPNLYGKSWLNPFDAKPAINLNKGMVSNNLTQEISKLENFSKPFVNGDLFPHEINYFTVTATLTTLLCIPLGRELT